MISSAIVGRYASALADVVTGPSGMDAAQAIRELRGFEGVLGESAELGQEDREDHRRGRPVSRRHGRTRCPPPEASGFTSQRPSLTDVVSAVEPGFRRTLSSTDVASGFSRTFSCRECTEVWLEPGAAYTSGTA